MNEQGASLPVRVPWNAFPDVIVHSSIYKLKCLPTYFAAKQGDHKAASRIAHALVKTENIAAVDFVVPVIQVDRGRYKAIPVALVQFRPSTSGPNFGWTCGKSTRCTTRMAP